MQAAKFVIGEVLSWAEAHNTLFLCVSVCFAWADLEMGQGNAKMIGKLLGVWGELVEFGVQVYRMW